MRVGFVLRVKPDRVDEYVAAHRQVWPELLDALRAAGIRNYTIFRAGNEMFGYFETDDLARANVADNAAALAGAEHDYDALDLAIATYEQLLANAERPEQREALDTAIRTLRAWKF